MLLLIKRSSFYVNLLYLVRQPNVPVDCALLANEQIWDNTVRVAEFVGNRFWRKHNIKITPTQAKKSV